MKNYARSIEEPLVLAAVDVIIINAGVVLAFALRFGPAFQNSAHFSAYLELAPALSLIAVALLYVGDLYSNWLQRTLMEITYSVFVVSFGIAIATMAAIFWTRQFEFPRMVVALSLVMHITLLTNCRWAIRTFLRTRIGGKGVMIVAETMEAPPASTPC